MRADAPPLEVAAAGLVQDTRVSVWYAGRQVAHDIPVGDGRVVVQADQDVPERLDVALPREWDGVTLDPARRGAVLGSGGHRLAVATTLTTPDGTRRWHLPLGTFLVTSWGRDGASITVQGDGLLRLVDEHDRATPGGIRAGTPISALVGQLLAEDGLETYVHPALPARRVPAGFTWGTDRMASLKELAAAWPAVVRGTPDGKIGFYPPPPADITTAPALSWHDGVGGTVLAAPIEGDRKSTFNHFVVTVHPWNDAPEYMVEHSITTGRLARSVFGTRTQPVDSPAVTNDVQAREVARAAASAAHVRSRVVPVEMVPDWRVQLDDPAEVVTSDGVREWGRVTGTDFPLTPSDGKAVVHVGVMS